MAVQSLASSGIATWAKYNLASTGERSLLAPAYVISILSGNLDGGSRTFYSSITDSQNNLYIRASIPNTNTTVVKLSADRSVLWARDYTEIGSFSHEALALDANEDLIIGTRLDISGNAHYGAVRISKITGEIVGNNFNGWRTTTYNTSPSGWNDCSFNSKTGNVYHTSDFNPGGVIAVQAFKYNVDSGITHYTPGYVFNSDTRPDGVMEIPDGSKIYVFYNAYTNSSYGWNPVISQFESNFSRNWSRIIGTAGDSGVYVWGAAVGNDAAPVVSFSGGNTSLGITQLNSSGNTVWTRKAGSSTLYAIAGGVARDASGNVYVLAHRSGTTAYLIKFDSTGNILWQRSIAFGDLFETSRSSIHLSQDGNYLQIVLRVRIFNTYYPVFINYPTNGSITGSVVASYYNWTIAASAETFNTYTSQNETLNPSTYTNNPSSNSRTFTTTSTALSETTESVFLA